MIDKCDKSLEESESDKETNGKSGPTMFCISPPPRKFSKRNTERSKVLTKNTNKEISPNTHLQSENMRNENRQEKPVHEESEQLKNVAFCVSPPARKPTKMETQHIIKKLRHGRMNDVVSKTGRQPLKADHATGTHQIDSQINVDNSSPKQENEKHTNSGANGKENGDRFTENTGERKENQKESMLRMLKMCAENQRNIRKLRDEVAEAKTNVWKCYEEEEQWNCRSEIHKIRVNASLTKINKLKLEKPHLFPKPSEREVKIDESREDLIKCRMDLIFQLSQVKDVMKEAIDGKTMVRRRLGVTYPMWFLSEFQEEYLKYKKTHGFHQPSVANTLPVCPPIDIAVFGQKEAYNTKQNFKILIDGRQFSYKNLGLTQVLTTVNEESCSHGEFGLVFPKIALNKTESRKLFREPQTTSNFDVEYSGSSGCSNLLKSLTDPHSLMVKNFQTKKSIRYLPPLHNTSPSNDNINTTDMYEFWQNTEKVKSQYANGTRPELKEIPVSNRNFRDSESEESIVATQRKNVLKQFVRTANEKNYQIMQEHLPSLAFIDHIPKINVWQSSHMILPDIRKFNEIPLTTCGDTKRQINLSSKDGSYSILCDPKMVAVKILHRDKCSNNVTYLTAFVNREIILPFSVTRRGSLIPVRMEYLKELFHSQLNTPRFGSTQSTMSAPHTASRQAVPSWKFLYTSKELSNEFDENTDETTMKLTKSSPFYKNQLNQSNSSLVFFHQEEMISPSEQALTSSRHNEGKNVQVLDEGKQHSATSNRTQNKKAIISTETRNIVYCPGLLTPECLRTKNEKRVGDSVQKLSRIPVLCLGNKTDKISGKAAQKPIRIPLLCQVTRTLGNAAHKPSRIPVLCQGTKQLGNPAHKASRIPVLCQGTETLGNPDQKPSGIPVLRQGTKKAVHTAQKPNRIPVLFRAKMDPRKCTSSSEIPSDVAIPYGKQIFVPHPPTQRKPTRSLLTKRLFSKYTKV